MEDAAWFIRLGGVLLLLILCFFLQRLLGRLASKRSIEPTLLGIFRKTVSIAIFSIAALIILDLLGLDIAPLLAFGGIGAAALGFASKDAISNFYGGLTIYLTRPFLLGDQVELPEKKLIGTIEKIGWYFTTLRDLSKKPVYIPNGLFSTELLINQSRMTHRYFDERLPLRYSDAKKLSPLIEEIRRIFRAHPEIEQHLPLRIFIHSLTDSSIVLEIKAYCLKTRYEEFMEIRQEILIRICEVVEGAGVGIGYPVQEQIHRPFSI